MPETTPAARTSVVNRVGPPVVVVAPAERPTGRRPGWFVPTLLALVAVGGGLRAAAYLGGRPLWVDEAMLALNLLDRSPARLLEPLDWNQGAPAGFLLPAKLAVLAFGTGELALRLVPFVGSLAGLAGFAVVAARLLSKPAAALAVGLFAVSPALVSYAGECKQYATDAAVAVGLLALSLKLFDGATSRWRWVVLAAAGAVAVWASHPAAFVLGGIGTALLTQAAVARDRGRLLATAGVVGCWLASFAGCYFVTLRGLGRNRYLTDYWAGHFLPLPPTGAGDLAWLVDHYFGFFQAAGGLGGAAVPAGGLAGALAVVGAWRFARDRWPVAVALVLPAAFALLASAVQKYPFGGRLLLFLAPAAVLLVARGAAAVVESLRTGQPVAAAALAAVLVAGPAFETYRELAHPSRLEDLPRALAGVRERWQPGDRLYVYYGAAPAFAYYSREGPFPADDIVPGVDSRGDRLGYRGQVAALGRGRVWLVFSHRHRDEEATTRAYADGFGRCISEVKAAGAAAYLYDFGG